jgi:hypothetical protein
MSRFTSFLVTVVARRIGFGTALFLLAAPAGGCIGVSAKPPEGTAAVAAGSIKRCKKPPRVAADGLFDDIEDGNTQVVVTGGRDGYWWSASNSNGSFIEMSPDDGGPGNSQLAMHASGETISPGDWGAQAGVNFVSKTSDPYDASRYVGVAFKAKIGAKSTHNIRFDIGDVDTHPVGNLCTACWNHFGKDLVLTQDWKEYQVLFASTEQRPGWGNPRPASIRPDKLISMVWNVGAGETFDLWIDDIQMLVCD